MNKTKVYIPVSVETPPEKTGVFVFLSDNSFLSKSVYAVPDSPINEVWQGNATHYLQPVERYVLEDMEVERIKKVLSDLMEQYRTEIDGSDFQAGVPENDWSKNTELPSYEAAKELLLFLNPLTT